MVYKRCDNGSFVFSEKIDTGNGWVWAGCEDDYGQLYIACDEKIFVYSNGKLRLLKEFDTKVENLFFISTKGKRKAMLFADVGYRVEQFVFEKGNAVYKNKLTIGKEDDRYRPLSFCLCKNGNSIAEEIAVGCSSYKKSDGSYVPASIFKIEEDGSARSFFKSDMLGGWFRSIEYDDNSGCYVCAGLKYGPNNAAIVFNRKEKLVHILTGHNGYVSNARILKSENNALYIASTAYDGKINLYHIIAEKNWC